MRVLVLVLCLAACAKKKVEDPIKVRPEIVLDEEDLESLPER